MIKDIPGYENYYCIDTEGNVYSKDRIITQINPKTNSLLKSHIPIYKKHPKPKRSNTSYPKVDLNAYISKPTQPKLKQQQQHITHINNIHYTNTNIHSTIYNDNNNYYSYNRQQQRKNDLNSLISFANSIVS